MLSLIEQCDQPRVVKRPFGHTRLISETNIKQCKKKKKLKIEKDYENNDDNTRLQTLIRI